MKTNILNLKNIVRFAGLSLALTTNGVSTAMADDLRISFGSPVSPCSCQIKTQKGGFTENISISKKVTYRFFPDEDNKTEYYDTFYTNTYDLNNTNSHPSYRQALQSCHLTLASYISAGTCTPGSQIPAPADLITDELGERTRFFNLSASEQASLQFALRMAEIESDEELYRQITNIYRNQSEKDQDLLKLLLEKISGRNKHNKGSRKKRH